MKQSENAINDETERFFQDVPSKVALLVTCIVIALFGLFFVAGGLDRISESGGALQGIFFLILGSIIIFIGWRFWKSTTGARIILTPDEIILQKLLVKKRWRISDAVEIVSFPTIIYPRTANGRKLGPLDIHYLGIKARSGKISKFVLPKFSGNERLLEALEEKTSLSIQHIKDDETFEAWQRTGI